MRVGNAGGPRAVATLVAAAVLAVPAVALAEVPPPLEVVNDPTAPEPQPEAQGPSAAAAASAGSDSRGDPGRWYADPAGGVLGATGLVSLGIGIGLSVHARQLAKEGSSSFEAHAERVEKVEKFRYAGIGMLAAGGVLVIASAIRYGLVARKNREASRRVAVTGSGLRIRF